MINTTAKRLKEALNKKGLRQIDLARMTGLPKSAISQYIAGKIEPKQDKLYILAKALEVDVLWLMGAEDNFTNTPLKINSGYYDDPEVAALANQIRNDPDLRLLLDAKKNLSKEDMESIINITKSLLNK